MLKFETLPDIECGDLRSKGCRGEALSRAYPSKKGYCYTLRLRLSCSVELTLYSDFRRASPEEEKISGNSRQDQQSLPS